MKSNQLITLLVVAVGGYMAYKWAQSHGYLDSLLGTTTGPVATTTTAGHVAAPIVANWTDIPGAHITQAAIPGGDSTNYWNVPTQYNAQGQPYV